MILRYISIITCFDMARKLQRSVQISDSESEQNCIVQNTNFTIPRND